MLRSAEARCPSCGAARVLFLDPANGEDQEYVEDCEVCCRPTVITVRWDRGGPQISLDPE
ncbi:MAG: CPXCG motif-containing cysteine-rich protein [Gemmatimonadota bacterium]|nr:CPXCG motif-containing cysteine-rich protein [Gemmatimonadota bacterium]MDH5199030.1 CPXCG motif-containing cysteine-rich protein [Gemmatimonadota bacterium]